MMEVVAVETEQFLAARERILLIKNDIFFHLPMFFQFLHILPIVFTLQFHTIALFGLNSFEPSHFQK